MTQKKLCDELNFDTKYLSEIERGISLPSLPLLIAISDKLDVSVQFLIRGTDEINGESISGETLFYVPEAKGIKKDDHKMILRMLKDIVKSVKKNSDSKSK